MKIRKYNTKRFIIQYLLCLAVLLTLDIFFWIRLRSDRFSEAEKVAAQTADYIRDQVSGFGKYADVPAAWLDVEGDEAKAAIAGSGGEEYRASFERFARSLFDADSMTCVQLVPDGVIRYVYPENEEGALESLLGSDLKERKEAWETLQTAAESGTTAVLGPEFINKLGMELGFYMPVYYENGDLWGFTAFWMKLPDALKERSLDRLEDRGYDYELRFVMDSDSGKTDRIGGTMTSARNAAKVSFEIQDTEWILAVRPMEGWFSLFRAGLSILGMMLLAFVLVWGLTQWTAHREETMSRLKSDAKHDKMTGLLNHTASAEAIDDAMQTVEGGVLLLIDIDNFKTVNDGAGHLAGDEVLVEVANAMRSTFRRNDILGRYGGDEFIVYMVGDISIPDFSVKASQLQEKIRKIPVGTTGSFVTCSIGGARRCVETPTAESMVQRADQALYTSKGNGKDRFTIYDDAGSHVIVTPKDGANISNDFTLSE